jgi:hypothetical protein
MEGVQVDTMPINQSSKKRKSLFSSPSPLASRVPACGGMRSPMTSPLTTPDEAAADGVNLSAALTALKVSLKRDFESFAPPTPAVSPAHGRGMAKRARFDFESIDEETEADQKPRRRKQLSYFAIVGAFQRAAHEREVALQLECVVEASTD